MRKRQNNNQWNIVFSLVVLASLGAMLVNAGNLNPPGPPSPTMKTLDEVEARIPIKASDLPLTISSSGSYYLAETINFSTENTTGITITASDVTIDLNGYALIGPGTGGSGHGISASVPKVTVTNGSVSHWKGNGINLGGRGHQVRDIKADNNGANGISVGDQSMILDCTAFLNNVDGITSGQDSIVKACISYENQSRGIVIGDHNKLTCCVARVNIGDGIFTSGNCSVNDCSAYLNEGDGIHIGDDSSAINCISNTNRRGIYSASNGVVIGCIAYDNSGIGIDAYHTTIKNCTANGNNKGIEVNDNCLIVSNVCNSNSIGIHAHSEGNTIRSNSLTNNATGLDAQDHNYAAQNTFYGNTTPWTGPFTPGSGCMENIVIP